MKKDLSQKKGMVIYNNFDGYKIWVNTKAYKFHIQMHGEATQPKGYDIAADAIEEGYRLCKVS